MKLWSFLALAFVFNLNAPLFAENLPKDSIEPGFYNNAEGSPVVPLINTAQKSLEMEIYEMGNPKVIAAIRAALNRGVKVRIVKEPNPVGAPCKVFDLSIPASNLVTSDASCADQRKLVQDVNAAGGEYVPFSQTLCPNGQSCLQHGKIVIADNSVALISSGNFNSTNLCDLDNNPSTCNRDYSFITNDSDIANTLAAIIAKDAAGTAYDVSTLLSKSMSQKITVSPVSLQPLVAFIKSAKERIQVQNQYLKEPTINAALIEMAKSGVKVDVTVASACSFGKPSPSDRKKVTEIFSAFDKAGIVSKMFNKNILVNGKPGYLHAKAIVVDESRAWMGSVNGSTQAATLNREFGIFFNDGANVDKLSNQLDNDLNDPHEESWQDSLECAENN